MTEIGEEKITKARICQLLFEQCLMHEKVEIQINGQGPLFYTYIIDDPRKLGPFKVKDDLPEIIKPYEPFFYLKQALYILLAPLLSPNGVVQLNNDDRIRIRFYTGHFAFEANVVFERVIEEYGEKVMQVGFPAQMRVLHARDQFRVKVSQDSKIRLKIKSPVIGDFKPLLKDMSTRGLSFCVPLDYSKKLHVNNEISLILISPGGVELPVDARVCHFTGMPEYDNCSFKEECDAKYGPLKAICGVDYKDINQFQKMLLFEMMFFLQRECIISEKRELIRFNRELEAQVGKKTTQLREKDLKLLEMDRMVSVVTLAAGIAHEINNPLSFIKSSISFVNKNMAKMIEASKFWDGKPVPEDLLKEYKDYLKQVNFDYIINSMDKKFGTIRNGIERIMKIVNDLKSFSWIDQVEIEKIDINNSIEEAVGLLVSRGSGNVEFVKDLQEVPLYECVVKDIKQCFFQAIQNAMDAVEGNGVIRICSSYDEKEKLVIVKVIDNGTGMSPEVLKQVFNPFFTTKEVGSGTGVGLSIMERIAKRHGGKIELDSKEKVGTTVTITLPIECEMIEKAKTIVQ